MKRALVLGTLLTAACGGGPRPPQAPQKPKAPAADMGRPNIVFILTDDLDMSHVQYMPQLRRHIAAKGTTFSNMFVTYAVCAPSRASILTGQYAHNHGVVENRPPRGSFRRFFSEGREQSTVATWIQAAGYRTGLVGKYMNYYPPQRDPAYVPPGWDDWRGYFDFKSMAEGAAYYNYELNENGRVVRYAEAEKDYLTDVLRDKALDFIATTPRDQPFFLYLGEFAPHAPVSPADRHDNLFPDLKAPRGASFNEEDVSDKPAWLRAQPQLTPEVIAATDELYKKRVQAMQAVDDTIEALVRALEARGQLENTYIFFSSDNGFDFGGHRLDHGKGDAYDESIRVPLIVRGPAIAKGRVEPAIALNIDLAPTFAAIAQAQAPQSVDGRSLYRLLVGKATQRDWRKDFLVELRSKEDGGITEFAALRNADTLYVEYLSGERELYDLVKDPHQLESAHTTVEPETLEKLSQRLAALKSCKGENCRS